MDRKIVLISGGSSGAGLEKAKLFVNNGYEVIIFSRDYEKLKETQNEIGNVDIIPCDITKEIDRERLYNSIVNKYNRLDILINNAGIAKRYAFEKVSELESKTKYELEVNYIAPILMIKKFLPLLKRNGGKIVNITSGLVYVPLCIQPNYCASKAALHSYTVSLRWQLKESNVKVVEVFYPEMDTPFQEGHASERAISPEIAARIAYEGIVNGKEEIRVKGANLLYNMSKIIPNKTASILNELVSKQLKDVKLPN